LSQYGPTSPTVDHVCWGLLLNIKGRKKNGYYSLNWNIDCYDRNFDFDNSNWHWLLWLEHGHQRLFGRHRLQWLKLGWLWALYRSNGPNICFFGIFSFLQLTFNKVHTSTIIHNKFIQFKFSTHHFFVLKIFQSPWFYNFLELLLC